MELHAVLHKKHGQFLNNFFAKISDGLMAISHGLETYYKKINPRITVAFCAAAEPERLEQIKESQIELRDILGLPQDKVILLYSGNLHRTGNNDSYGIEDVVRAMPHLEKKFVFIGVGKKGEETKGHEALAREVGVTDRVFFKPWVDKQEVYRYWKAADILVLPAAGGQIGNSPTKMFEYLVMGKPIISAKTQAIQEVLIHKQNAILVTDYRKPEAWSEAVRLVSDNSELREHIVSQAFEDSKKYRWEDRGQHILNFINETI